MRLRRCVVLYLEPREVVSFDLANLLGGGNGLRGERGWIALAPHLGAEVAVGEDECRLLGTISPFSWTDTEALDASCLPLVERLLAVGLLVPEMDDGSGWRGSDDALRATHWHPLAATLHAFTRWQGIDTVQNTRDAGTETADELRHKFGAPPGECERLVDAAQQLPLPRIAPTGFDDLLARRATCRNFDASRKVPFDVFAQTLQRVFAAQAEVRVTEDTVFLKKNVPSGGGLHPMECYLIVQHVEGVAPGLYHYHAQDHALEPLPGPAKPLREFVMDMVAQQHWFADAHVVVMLSPRFDRTFWKYRHHAKGYRVIALEGGHLSQTLYLAATEAGLGAFITGAINEVELEQAFGLDPIHQGALAICGFGWRASVMETAELDPAERVWVPAGP